MSSAVSSPPAPDLYTQALTQAQFDRNQCAEDPWYAVKRGWVKTQDEHPPEGMPAVRALEPLEYLRAVTLLWQECPKGLMGKSRQMRASWLFAWLQLWDCLFHSGRHAIIQGKRLEDVHAGNPHAILGRARFIRQHLPSILQPIVKQENTTSETYGNGSTLEAIPEGADIVRGKVPSSMFMDEIAFHETAEANWNAAVPSADRLWGVSTPNGHEFLYRQAEPRHAWDDWAKWPEIVRGVHSYRNTRDVQLVFVHYTADPAYRTVEAQQSRKAGYSDVRHYLREQEGDFTLHEGLGVYANEFDRAKHVIERYEPDPMLPLYRGWDPGYNGQAVCFMQVNHSGQLVWFDQIIYKAVPLARVAQDANARRTKWMGRPAEGFGPGGTGGIQPAETIDAGDPAARAHNADGETDQAILSQHGIRLLTKTSSGRKADLVENIRQLLLPRSDGKPGMLVARNSQEMDHVIAGFSGGYHYGKPREGKAEKELPEKDGFYDHIFDSAQYAVDNISPIRYGLREQEPDQEWWREREPGIGQEAWASQ